jgi:hypothetical protein
MSNMGDRAEVMNRGHDRRLPDEYCLDATHLSHAGYDRMTELTRRNLPSFFPCGEKTGRGYRVCCRIFPMFPAIVFGRGALGAASDARRASHNTLLTLSSNQE